MTLEGIRIHRLDQPTERRRWIRVSETPNYALMPDGTPCPTTCFYKSLV
ncbi:MAG: hypothetical protein U0942_03190 [Parvibaculum sp.]|nr:hypothetical protein [Parvibaculum sp.]MDZ4380326.1 hypothetical protein [Parvibaculum sp.]